MDQFFQANSLAEYMTLILDKLKSMTKENFKIVAEDIIDLIEDFEINNNMKKSDYSYDFGKIHLLLYLALNDYCNARFLWMRISNDLKKKTELNEIHFLLEKIWKNQFDDILKKAEEVIDLFKNEANLSILLKMLRENTKKHLLDAIKSNFQSIPIENFSKIMNCNTENALLIVSENKWEIAKKNNLTYILPKADILRQSERTSEFSKENLNLITEMTIFMENLA